MNRLDPVFNIPEVVVFSKINVKRVKGVYSHENWVFESAQLLSSKCGKNFSVHMAPHSPRMVSSMWVVLLVKLTHCMNPWNACRQAFHQRFTNERPLEFLWPKCALRSSTKHGVSPSISNAFLNLAHCVNPSKRVSQYAYLSWDTFQLQIKWIR